MRLRIKNWAGFQHYKDRCPPWIKLHFKILHSKDWVSASDAERVLAISCMLIASQDEENNGSFDADPDYFHRVAYLNSIPDFKPLIDRGFLEVVDDETSRSKRMLANACTETETEAETEAEDLSVLPKPTARHKKIIDLYHQVLPQLPNVIESRWPGSTKEKNLNQRLKEDPRHREEEFWLWFFETAKTNPFWLGENDRGWKADLGWFLKRENFDKVIARGAT